MYNYSTMQSPQQRTINEQKEFSKKPVHHKTQSIANETANQYTIDNICITRILIQSYQMPQTQKRYVTFITCLLLNKTNQTNTEINVTDRS